MKNKTLFTILLLVFLCGLLIGYGLSISNYQREIKTRLNNIDNTMYIMALAQSYLSNNTIKCFELNNLFNKKGVD